MQYGQTAILAPIRLQQDGQIVPRPAGRISAKPIITSKRPKPTSQGIAALIARFSPQAAAVGRRAKKRPLGLLAEVCRAGDIGARLEPAKRAR